jgi:4'-phosphopantetheinyl transferase
MRGQATLWLLDLAAIDAAVLASGLDGLGASVQQRYRRVRRIERQRQFLAGRLLLRHALAMASGADAGQISFVERPASAPRVILPGTAPYFSISHAGRWVACAVSTSTPLGLDIEQQTRVRDFPALAEHSFDAATARRIAQLAPPQRAAAFYRAWCRLEAEYKLGQPARCWHHPVHAQLEIALCSVAPVELSIQVPDILHPEP